MRRCPRRGCDDDERSWCCAAQVYGDIFSVLPRDVSRVPQTSALTGASGKAAAFEVRENDYVVGDLKVAGNAQVCASSLMQLPSAHPMACALTQAIVEFRALCSHRSNLEIGRPRKLPCVARSR